jgi:hypothetical protein
LLGKKGVFSIHPLSRPREFGDLPLSFHHLRSIKL